MSKFIAAGIVVILAAAVVRTSDSTPPAEPESLRSEAVMNDSPCVRHDESTPPDSKASRDRRPVNDARFHARLLLVARTYESFGLVDDAIRWAPTLCWAPTPKARFSQADDPSPHGRKVYFLFARDREAYVSLGKPATSDLGDGVPPIDKRAAALPQAIVKESWIPRLVDAHEEIDGHPAFLKRRVTVEDDGKIYRADRRGPLFIILRTAPNESGSDEGWIYGTVNADRKTVTSAGRVASCMKCHVKADHGRLFGLQTDGGTR